ncbi:MAG: glycosyltransferase family 2 protein [Lachnospiraceae bacterium]|nr:glycosyltransferase family 2 protein [Lachnospiraceae bacterium]MBQ7777039.1 glycosyltransferase family 2 protein [Lachnospiraceae bacterium]
MNTPLISVVIPVYNIEKYLERCVYSVREQTYKNLEIILVDDGSTDASGALCDRLATEDARISVFHKENGGSSSARNLGISKAQGEFIGFVDSDDYIEPDMYELLYKATWEFDADIAQIGRDEIDEEGNALPNICEPPKQVEFIESEAFLKELLMHRGDCSFCTKLVRKSLFENMQFPIGELNEDFKLLVQMLTQIKGIVSLPKQTYHVFYRIGSNTRKVDKEAFSRVFGDNVNNADMVNELVQEKYPKLTDIAFRFGICQRLEYLLHVPISKMTGENVQYAAICKYMKKNWLKAMKNKHLTAKNKVYTWLFAIAPKGIRVVHKRLRRL